MGRLSDTGQPGAGERLWGGGRVARAQKPPYIRCGCFCPCPVIIRSVPNFCLQHIPDLGILRLEWVAYSDSRQLRASAEQLLTLLATLEIRCCCSI